VKKWSSSFLSIPCQLLINMFCLAQSLPHNIANTFFQYVTYASHPFKQWIYNIKLHKPGLLKIIWKQITLKYMVQHLGFMYLPCAFLYILIVVMLISILNEMVKPLILDS
jgi:hypothetical protein